MDCYDVIDTLSGCRVRCYSQESVLKWIDFMIDTGKAPRVEKVEMEEAA